MSQIKKYDYLTKQEGAEWSASIVRKVSSSKTVTSQKQAGFSSEQEAIFWAKQTLETFSQTQAKNNDRKSEQRKIALKTRQERSTRKATKTADSKAKKSLESSDDMRSNEEIDQSD